MSSLREVSNPILKRGSWESEHLGKEADCQNAKASQQQTFFDRLPLEMLEEIAKELLDSDIENVSTDEVSVGLKTAALREKNIREMNKAVNELKVLADLNPGRLCIIQSSSDVYRNFIRSNFLYITLNRQPERAIQPSRLKDLKHALMVLSTQQVANEFIELKNQFSNQIANNKASFKSIDETYLSTKNAYVAQASNYVISSTINPIITRGVAVSLFSKNGVLDVVKQLLESGDIEEQPRGDAVRFAAYGGHLEVIKTLLAGHSITEQVAGSAIQDAALKGHLEIIKFLLEKQSITEEARSEAVGNAATHGYFEVAKYLLDQGAVSISSREDAFRLAAAEGKAEFVKYALANGVISSEARGSAVINTALHGDLELTQELLLKGEISEIDRGWAVMSAAEKGYLGIVHLLLANGSISMEARVKAAHEGAFNGHLDVVQFMLASGAMSDEHMADLIQVALRGGHGHIAEFLKQNLSSS